MHRLSLGIRIASAARRSASASGIDAQRDHPTRPVRIIVPFPPGGSADPMARFVAGKLSERRNGATMGVDHRPGGHTIIGNSIVAKATPDGYPVGDGGGALFSTPHFLPNVPLDVPDSASR
jgi:tripartite-type tricarboxylate transporter receptor subunit TctC